jgi:hypothetical protein
MDRKKSKTPHGKYDPAVLIRMFRKAANLRNDMLAEGFTDNGGAIHCAERILDILGQRLNYPGLSHGNALRHYKNAEFPDALGRFIKPSKRCWSSMCLPDVTSRRSQ